MAQLTKYSSLPTFRSMLENFWNNPFDDDWLRQSRMPAVNVKDTETSYQIELAVPGFKKDELNIAVENGVLTISAENKEEKEQKNGQYTRQEFSCSSFSRSFSLPDNVDQENIQAKYEDGVLKLTVAKRTPEKPQKKTISLT